MFHKSTVLLLLLGLGIGSHKAVAQQDQAVGTSQNTVAVTSPKPAARTQGASALPKFGIGVKVSSLGIGVEAGTALTQRTNLRVGFNAFSYSHTFEDSGVSYGADLTLRSIESHFDWFPFGGGFRLSPGVLFTLKDPATASALVGSQEAFTLNDVDYFSDPNNPIRGNASFKWNNKVAPMFTLGWGNLLRRSGRHWTIPFEVGIAVMGAPKVNVSLHGGACDRVNNVCTSDVTTDPTFQSNLNAQINKINNDVDVLKVYPILSTGLAYRF